MAEFLVDAQAVMVCTHELGKVQLTPSQHWVTVDGVPVLVAKDPEGRPIVGCPNLTVVTKPCTSTLSVKTGYSDLIFIDGKAACLDILRGITDGPGGAYEYKVNFPRQRLVTEGSRG